MAYMSKEAQLKKILDGEKYSLWFTNGEFSLVAENHIRPTEISGSSLKELLEKVAGTTFYDVRETDVTDELDNNEEINFALEV